jgi:hypothetical protein
MQLFHLIRNILFTTLGKKYTITVQNYFRQDYVFKYHENSDTSRWIYFFILFKLVLTKSVKYSYQISLTPRNNKNIEAFLIRIIPAPPPFLSFRFKHGVFIFSSKWRWRIDCERTTDYGSQISCLNLTSFFALFVSLLCRLTSGAFTIDSSTPTLSINLNE